MACRSFERRTAVAMPQPQSAQQATIAMIQSATTIANHLPAGAKGQEAPGWRTGLLRSV